MKKRVFGNEAGFGPRLIGSLVVFATVMSFLGCVAAIPVAVLYYEREHEYIITAQMPKNADTVFQTAKEVGEEMSTERKIKILKTEDHKRLIKAESISQPPRKGSLEVHPVADNSSQMIATGERGKYETEDKALSFEAIKRVAEKLGVEYKVVKVVR